MNDPLSLGRRRFVQTAAAAAAVASAASAAEPDSFRSDWQGSRVWIGPEYWANPLQNWRVAGGEVRALAGAGRNLHLLTHQGVEGEGGLRMSVEVRLVGRPAGFERTWVGFEFGVQGALPGYEQALVHRRASVAAGVRGDGRLFVDGVTREARLPLDGPLRLELHVRPSGADYVAEISAGGAKVSAPIDASRLPGNLALAAQAPGPGGQETSGVEWAFRDWRAGGPQVAERPEQTFGPILWTQYTLSRRTLKLLAHFPPLGESDSWTAALETRPAGGEWTRATETPIDRLSRTALFRIDDWDDTHEREYRVVYRWRERDYRWDGLVRADPRGRRELRIGVFSCDHGEVFPQKRMVRNVRVQDPDVVFFAGDQIYESHGGFGVGRGKPVEEAMLDYLRKYWQFGWSFRDILRDRPSIVVPDDHDVFQGNIWGHGGRPIQAEFTGANFELGGYLMPVEWVNAIQRTQSAHLPDPANPAPCEGGIEVYFTELRYGGASFAIVEDRKFKSGPRSIFSEAERAAARQNPALYDAPEAEMLGLRQEEFLRRWTASARDADFRIVCSQTLFCKATTHTGRDLTASAVDVDSGGWPPAARNRALRILSAAPGVVMLHGDQHLGILARQGVDDWDDGPIGFMVPGVSNGFPRAWRPERPGENRAPGAPPWTGRYRDGFGNRMTILGAANPEPGSNTAEGQRGLDPAQIAHIKGSGHGVVILDRERRTATFETWRFAFDAVSPRPEDQFEGFPITIELPA